MVVEGWLARAAAARPAHPALITPAGSWSYAQLLAAAYAGAQELAHAGVQAGARVAIELPGGLAFAQAMHACMLLGAVAVAHVGGLSIIVRSAIYGTTAVVHERFEAERALHALREGRVTVASLVATTLARLLNAGLDGSGALRCALTGGGPVPAEL